MAAMNIVSTRVLGGKLSLKKVSAGGRLCTLQANPHFWVPVIKVRPPDGNLDEQARSFCAPAYLPAWNAAAGCPRRVSMPLAHAQ